MFPIKRDRKFVLRIGGTVETAGLYLKVDHPTGRAVELEFATTVGSRTSAYRLKRDWLTRSNRVVPAGQTFTLTIEEVQPPLGTGPFEPVKPEPCYFEAL